MDNISNDFFIMENKLTDEDIIELARFFDEYLRDEPEISNELKIAIGKIFEYTSWFDPKDEDYGWSD